VEVYSLPELEVGELPVIERVHVRDLLALLPFARIALVDHHVVCCVLLLLQGCMAAVPLVLLRKELEGLVAVAAILALR